jgi:RNA-directed DNA polymerase
VDTDYQSDNDWLLSVQRKLYRWSKENPEERYRELWNWVTDIRNLRCAWQTVATNKGRRTPGIDGVTVKSIQSSTGGVTEYLERLQEELRSRMYRPSPVRRKLIPKRGKPGTFRPLGIPTVKDRVVQAALKQLLEPIFEAGFSPVSYGFRPGKACRDAIEHIRVTIRPQYHKGEQLLIHPPYQWVIEGDIAGCFDHIDHHLLMDRVRKRIKDIKVLRLVRAFLKAGVLAESSFERTPMGTPQGGILSPLLANIMLSAIEERYQRWVRPQVNRWGRRIANPKRAGTGNRQLDRQKGRPVFYPIRYADDFIVLVSGAEEDALQEKENLAVFLRESLKLSLSEEKTLVTPVTKGFLFLGHWIRLRWDDRYGYWPRIEVPKEKVRDLKRRLKAKTKRNRLRLSLKDLIKELNPILRGWGYFYRHCYYAGDTFSSLDSFAWLRINLWLRKKYRNRPIRRIVAQFFRRPPSGRCGRWTDGVSLFLMGEISVYRYSLRWTRYPDYAFATGEPSA